MKEIKVVDIKLKIIRGRVGPADRRFQYSTLIEYFIGEDEGGKVLTMGLIPPTYFFLKQVLNEDLNDLERVIYHNIRKDDRKILRELFITNNLIKINLKNTLSTIIDRVVIDKIDPIGSMNYNFSASLYLNNGQRVPNVIPSDAAVIALIANKDIFIVDDLFEEKDRIDDEIEERLSSKKTGKPSSEEEEIDIPKNIYT